LNIILPVTNRTIDLLCASFPVERKTADKIIHGNRHGVTIQLFRKLDIDYASYEAGNCWRADALPHLNDAGMIEGIERHLHRNAIFTLATLTVN
jgi:hypothetical protein